MLTGFESCFNILNSGSNHIRGGPSLPGLRTPSDVRREDILDAARKCILESGFDQVTIEQIAARAGVSPGLLYYYFEDKEDLVIAGLAAVEDELQRGMEERLRGCSAATEKLHAWIDYLLPSDTNKRMWQFWSEVRMQAIRHSRILRLCIKTYEEWRRIREGFLAEGVRSGEFRPMSVRVTGEMLGALIEGLASRSLIHGYLSPSEMKEVMATVVVSLKANPISDSTHPSPSTL